MESCCKKRGANREIANRIKITSFGTVLQTESRAVRSRELCLSASTCMHSPFSAKTVFMISLWIGRTINQAELLTDSSDSGSFC